jgi:hypothetical protein
MWVSDECDCHCQPSDEEHPYLKQVKKQISSQDKAAEATVLCVGRHLNAIDDITKPR